MTRTTVWVKIPKLCHKNPAIYLFFLEKGGNPYISKPYIKNLSKSALSTAPSTQIILIQTLCG